MKILAVNGVGGSGQDARRIRQLTEGFPAEVTHIDLDRSTRKAAFAQMEGLLKQPWDLVYLENTGIAGGIPLIRAAARGVRYIVSSGDPVAGFFHVTEGPVQGQLFGIYEKLLYRRSVGFVGWTPYLTGRALELGAPRGVTVEGAVDTELFRPLPKAERLAFRQKWGIGENQLVCGLVGSLVWSERQQYAYGLELVETLARTKRRDLTMLIVGDGDAKARLEARVPAEKKSQIVFTGRLPQDEVVLAMNAMDIGCITQTLDQLGMYRLTTKLPEYLATGLPVAMSPIPGFFDYIGEAAGWSLPEHHPGREPFWNACASWLDSLTQEEIAARSATTRALAVERFNIALLRPRFQAFLRQVTAP